MSLLGFAYLQLEIIHVTVAYFGVMYSVPPQSHLWNFPKKFHTLELELVDCSILLNLSPIPGNRSVQLNLFQEVVMQVGPEVFPIGFIDSIKSTLGF